MATHFKLAHLFFSYECLEAQPSSCDSNICACPCHYLDSPAVTPWMQSHLGLSILHLAFAYPRSPWFDTTFATAVKQAKLHPQKETS